MRCLSHIHANLGALAAQTPITFRDDLAAGLEAMHDTLNQVQTARNELNAIESALKLLLELLNAGHTQPLLADSLYCLLAPLQTQLSDSLAEMDRLL